MIERDFDVPFVADLALREKQIQQNYRPIIAVHKWFARRPGTLFRGILLSEFSQRPLREAFYSANAFPNVRVLDPFMGGGTPLVEANRIGCQVTGFDINPMAYWIVREELESLDLAAYRAAARDMREQLQRQVGSLYRTKCAECGKADAEVKYFLWVKVIDCGGCGREIDLFPNYLVAEDVRHPRNVFECWNCGLLYEDASRKQPGPCVHCGEKARKDFAARRGMVKCRDCSAITRFPNVAKAANGAKTASGRNRASTPPRHRMFAIEYFCSHCRTTHEGRFFKAPDSQDLQRYRAAEKDLANLSPKFIPEDAIPAGDETDRLHRWGYRKYSELFNARQLLGLELSCCLIDEVDDAKIRRALATNLSDLLRYQNMLCRYDTMALKSLDIFSVHGFPVGQIQCESNLLGIPGAGKQTNVGSGGWLNMTEKFSRAKAYCEEPFEIRHAGTRKEQVFIRDEWIGEKRNGVRPPELRIVKLSCSDATAMKMDEASFDAVLTDPPYFGNVQYAELMDFCYIWLRRLAGRKEKAFTQASTRHQNELTGNINMGRALPQFAEGLSKAFENAARALRPGAPFVFTYHHNQLESYFAVAMAILDARLVCSASLPCPAEMGGSIHINGTGSSILDTIFVCRSTGRFPRRWLVSNAKALADLVAAEVSMLRQTRYEPSQGDIRCMIYGHLIRLAVWHLRRGWTPKGGAGARLARISAWIENFGGLDKVREYLGPAFAAASPVQRWEMREVPSTSDEISF